MSNIGASGKAQSRRYTPEEKAQAVRMVFALRKELGTKQGTVRRVADQLGYGVESVRGWVKQAEIDSGETPGATSAEQVRPDFDTRAGFEGVVRADSSVSGRFAAK